jgi:hypothetical protein
MSDIIEHILQTKVDKNKLKNYIYIPSSEWYSVPLGSHIKFIDRNENIKSGGFLIKCVTNDDITKCYYILKSNVIYKLYIYYYWIFSKEIIHETKFSKIIKPYKELTNDTSTDLKTGIKTINIMVKKDNVNKKSNNKRDAFLNLLKK